MVFRNKQVTRRLLEEVWNQGKLELIDELLDPAYEGFDPLMGPLKRESYRSAVKGYRRAFPDLELQVRAVVAEGNFVTTRWIAHGTHLGPFLGTESSGRSAEVTGMEMSELSNGKLISGFSEWDALGLFRQLGLEHVTVPLAVRKAAQQQSRFP